MVDFYYYHWVNTSDGGLLLLSLGQYLLWRIVITITGSIPLMVDFCYYHWINTSDGGLLLLSLGQYFWWWTFIIRPAVSAYSLTWLIIYRLMHALFHIRIVIIPRDRYRLVGFKACIDLFITYFNIELKRTKLTSHTHTKLWVIDIGWGMITVLIWKKACIVLFMKRFDIMLFYL
jgi:hypothetical protein